MGYDYAPPAPFLGFGGETNIHVCLRLFCLIPPVELSYNNNILRTAVLRLDMPNRRRRDNHYMYTAAVFNVPSFCALRKGTCLKRNSAVRVEGGLLSEKTICSRERAGQTENESNRNRHSSSPSLRANWKQIVTTVTIATGTMPYTCFRVCTAAPAMFYQNTTRIIDRLLTVA